MTKELVTIGIPAYKSEFLREAIDSALSQDYDNIELVIVNDASPYDIDSIVNSYDDQRIKYFKNKRNLGHRGLARNWNRCLEYAKGDFFALLCDDDVLLPNFVSVLLKLAKENIECNVFHARRHIYRLATASLSTEPSWPMFETSVSYSDNFFKGLRKHTVTEFLYRTEHVRKIKYQNYPVGFYSDNVSLMLFSKEGGIVSSQEPLVIFRESNIHISTNPKYNPGKALATRKFLHWAKLNHICDSDFDNQKRRIERQSIGYLYESNGWTMIRVIFCLPISSTTIPPIFAYVKYLVKSRVRKLIRNKK